MICHSDVKADSELARAHELARLFDIADPVEIREFKEKGNINQQTYLVTAGPEGKKRELLLQLLNPDVFTCPRAVMQGMILCIRAQEEALAKGLFRGQWETVRLIPTRNGNEFLEVAGASKPECWRMMVRIGESKSCRSLQEMPDRRGQLEMAEQAGRGLALFGLLTAGMDVSRIACPLPGYRNTDLYYNQLLAILAGCRTGEEAEPYMPDDSELLKSTERLFLIQIDHDEHRRRVEDPELRPFIDLSLEQKPFGLSLFRKLESGELRKVVVHGDTKLDNFLFDSRSGKVKALVDLDTIMPHTWLSDWGDMVRSLVNIAGELEQDLGRVDVDQEVFAALARGYLGAAPDPDPYEVGLMADAPAIMALELGVRFLADYLRGDNYFQLIQGAPRDLNKIRAKVQFRLFEKLRSNADRYKQMIAGLRPTNGPGDPSQTA